LCFQVNVLVVTFRVEDAPLLLGCIWVASGYCISIPLTLSTLMCDNIAPHVQLFFAQRSKVVHETKWYSCTL